MKRKQNDIGALIILVLIGLLLGRFQTSARNAGHTDPISHLVRLVVSPAAGVLDSAAYSTSGFFGAVGHGRQLEDENRRLRAIAQAAQSYDSDLDRLQKEIDELRKLGGWEGGTAHEKVPADVIGYFPHESRITLSAGAEKGLKRGMPVATYEGLVGRVETVDRNTCQVLLITSPASESRISALVQGRGTAGLIRGDGANSLSIEIADPKATVAPGDIVTTSGFSDEIPRGIVIGKIEEVQDDKVFGRRTASIRPSVSLGAVREVLVIK